MECLDTEMLCRYLDADLDAGMSSAVAAHLHTCRQCMERLETFAANDASLRRVLPQPRRSTERTPACYSAEALSAYASGQLPPAEDTRCEQHLLTCDVCLQEVMAIRGTLAVLHREPLLAPPAHLTVIPSRAANPQRQASVETLGTLVIQFVRNGLEFVEALLLPAHVRLAIGEQLVPVGTVRSTPENAAQVAFLDIQQSVRDFTCRIRVFPEDASTVQLTVQLTRQGTGLGRKRVSLSKNGRLLASQHTSGSGEAVFSRVAPGEYTLRIPQENVETQVVLRAAEEGPERG